jgi:hypothetical protein
MPQTKVSHIRNRDSVLGMLLPKILGILWETGQRDKFGANTVFDKNISISASPIRKNAIVLDVWSPDSKMLSIHLADEPVADQPHYFRYQSGRCSVLSWKRGAWEDRIMTAAVEPREIAQMFISGLVSDEI